MFTILPPHFIHVKKIIDYIAAKATSKMKSKLNIEVHQEAVSLFRSLSNKNNEKRSLEFSFKTTNSQAGFRQHKDATYLLCARTTSVTVSSLSCQRTSVFKSNH